ncbi:SRPBCC family protein [Pigmentiphaga litoralis]|mgnify:CR=1 FL=1|uniref:Carbon monoxide dehydrogenase n=1 Tax=Pigmentiphaga litoralis TaxID=516702 RepID=A0A7Y9LML5_9BURK|nr:SRPBCC family protein [Pigmentiphaga litoralis]NYE24575.1 hypothetical protein [Pigmentiphaga litoralis]NYE81811.1 hypothetical protein [Pigmentiphaga litoralis]
MQFANSFEVSLPPEQAWPVLMDVTSVVPCMPGAELTEVIDDRHFKGKVSVRLGPVALSFNCTAAFEDVDDTAHRARIVSRGTDAKGRGGANATIALSLSPSAKGSRVDVQTDLAMSGAVAQYGRGSGVIQSVATQIISQFSKNLEARIEQLRGAGALDAPGSTQAAAVAPVHAASTPPAAPAPVQAKPISGFALLWASFRATAKGWFGAR